jgi:uncharacterized protein (DUF952 family)
MRWLYHLRPEGGAPKARCAPASLATEGFVHASYRDDVLESARLHFPPGAALEVLRIDPRLLDVPVQVAATPRGDMPHIHGSIPLAAVARVMTLAAFEAELGGLPDVIG